MSKIIQHPDDGTTASTPGQDPCNPGLATYHLNQIWFKKEKGNGNITQQIILNIIDASKLGKLETISRFLIRDTSTIHK